MAKTVAELAEVACRLSRNDPTEDPDAFNEACGHIVDVQTYVCGMDHPWDFLQKSGQFTPVGGADVYLLADLASIFQLQGIKRVLSIVDDRDGSNPLRPLHWMALERMVGSTQSGDSGAPVAWCPVGTQAIRLWPVPTGGELLGMLFEILVSDAQPDTPVILPDSFSSPVLATWAAARMWEQHAGLESRMMADRLDSRHEIALRRMVEAHGTVRWPYLNFAEPGYMADPGIAIITPGYNASVY